MKQLMKEKKKEIGRLRRKRLDNDLQRSEKTRGAGGARREAPRFIQYANRVGHVYSTIR